MYAELADSRQAMAPQQGVPLGLLRSLGQLGAAGQLHSVAFERRAVAPPTSLLRSVLDALNLGLVLVDADARVLHANQAAQALCKAGAPITLNGHSMALTPSHRQQLDVALRAALRRQWAMLVLRQGALCLSVGVVPMSGDAGHPGLAAMLVIAPQGQPSGLALQFFCQAHHLTPAESTVLLALCKGQKPTQIAAAGGVAISTVRTQVAAVREKTQASSVSHLLQLVGALPPMAAVCGHVPAAGAWASA